MEGDVMWSWARAAWHAMVLLRPGPAEALLHACQDPTPEGLTHCHASILAHHLTPLGLVMLGRLRDQWSMWMLRMDGWMKSLHGFLFGIKWIMFHGRLDCFQKSPLGGRPNTKPGDHGILNAHNRWLLLFYHVWGPTRIEIRWNIIWLRAPSHVTSQFTWGSVTKLHDFGGVLGRLLNTFFWALTSSWSRPLCVKWPWRTNT